ncbi:cytidylyltransferase domain-containing protein [Paenibacillus piri]|uniref:Acylneuraminate cytidylyltransferase family protein n=1 Tax=Paenibacillus piri TaxID=2547395 RepID=A0A4R5KFT3_9BACL|nr:acylneuraminate cytidylyltransferase family protein [Paenibacillus piri]TDF93488.1 acylneuraminate cytidylyltransferase family protein [Paenibacillus piri]
MIEGKSVLAIIPARGGSKGVPRKNIKDLAGKPLIAWTIDQAQKSNYIDRLILSSEDAEIIEVARALGCEIPFVRPAELATDETSGLEPVWHALNHVPSYDYIVLLQPTSPLRTAADIDTCLELCIQHNAPSCVSVTVPDKSPYWMYTLDEESRMTPFIDIELKPRRQDMPPLASLNGAVYAAECEWLQAKRTFITKETIAYFMPRERSIDIDSEFDLQVAGAIIGMNL